MNASKGIKRQAVLTALTVIALCLPAAAWAAESPATLQAGVIAPGDAALATQTLGSSGNATTTYAGDTMYETAVAQAKAAYPNGASIAIIAGPGDAWVDALSSAGLAGAIDGPILFSNANSMHAASLQALKELRVKEVIIVGGTAAVGAGVESDLEAAGIAVKERLWGQDCYGTNLAIYEYGEQEKLWTGDLAIVATGTWFGDALSISPVAFAKCAPIFLADSSLELNASLKDAWERAARAGVGKTTVAVGGPAVVSQATVDFAGAMSKLAGGSGAATWLWGQEQYETSGKIAEWAVRTQEFSWNNAAFTTGNQPYDALAGSVLQGKTRSVLLLADHASSATISTAASYKGDISHVRFFGGYVAMPALVRTAVTSALSDRVKTEFTGITYARMLALEPVKSSKMNPANYSYGEYGYYQFAALNAGYSGVMTASDLDAFINRSGSDGMLAGHGQDFVDAAKAYGVNEVYLLSHAILESGWGRSALAMGYYYSGGYIDGSYYPAGTYYNFYGIGAYDSSPLSGGRKLAIINGWNTPRAAIMGAAKWIKSNYVGGLYNQNTLYKMRWNYVQAAREGAVWKQYATSEAWAESIARVMNECYAYCGYDMSASGLTFLVPQYS